MDKIEMDGTHTQENERCWAILRMIHDSSPVGIYVVDLQGGHIRFFNDAFLRIWGLEHLKTRLSSGDLIEAELIRQMITKAIDGPALEKALYHMGKGAMNAPAAEVIQLLNGRTVKCRSSGIRKETITPPYHIYIFDDVTEVVTAREEAVKSSVRYKELVDLLPQIVFEIDLAGNLTFVNQSAFSVMGYTEADLLQGMNVLERVVPEDRERVIQNMQRVLSGRKSGHEYTFMHKDGSRFPVIIHSSVIYQEGIPVGFRGIIFDITERKLAEERLKESLHEKEVLLKEVHHRVKNNMQIISSLLHLQLSGIDQEPVRQILTESQNRIKSIALVHERIYMSDDLARIDFKEYMKSLSAQLLHSYSTGRRLVNLTVMGDPIHLGVDQAVPCGLIMNELVSNSLKHAFPGYKGGTIKIHLRDGSTNQIIIEDDGVGMPENFCLTQVQSMGMQLVAALVDQLDGTITLDRSGGTRFTITFSVR